MKFKIIMLGWVFLTVYCASYLFLDLGYHEGPWVGAIKTFLFCFITMHIVLAFINKINSIDE
jgi:hypothetical protein